MHNALKYYSDRNGDGLIWFVDHVIGGKTVVSGHWSGGLLAAYVAAYGGDNIKGAVLEDAPVFSTEPDYFQKSFAYVGTYQVYMSITSLTRPNAGKHTIFSHKKNGIFEVLVLKPRKHSLGNMNVVGTNITKIRLEKKYKTKRLACQTPIRGHEDNRFLPLQN